nr:cysteine proteinase-like isoform X2 [Populus alba]
MLGKEMLDRERDKPERCFSIQIPESIQELKKALSVLPQLSSHPKPGCLGETCVFFAVIGAVEGRYRLHMIRNNPDHATVPQLSVQDAIDGIKQVPIDPATCLNWIIKQGVVPESDCPYIGVPQGGHVLKEGRLSMVNGYRFINPGGDRVEGIVEEIMEGGPIVGIISYQSEYLHAVMLIGGVYKDDRVDEYVIQNSWGTGWEEDGRGLVPISYLVGAYVPVSGRQHCLAACNEQATNKRRLET